ncbi:MAG: DUF488 domain-containing protein [Thermomicrobiales bacterium]
MKQSEVEERATHTITTQRIYDDAAVQTGKRILVDRLWSRGVTRERAALDLWLKEVAPSTALRQWFHSGQGSWEEFRTRYEAEPAADPAPFEVLLERARQEPIVLLYGARDEEQNHAVILKRLLKSRLT